MILDSVYSLDTQQAIIVIAENWNAPNGVLYRYEKQTKDEPWRKVGTKIKVVLGKNGMGWGIGLHGNKPITEGPIITEGSKRSPAGIFKIPFAFGKSIDENLEIKFPYKEISNTIFCIDDPKSKNYNKIIDTKLTIKDWNNAENMQQYLHEGLYTYGITFNHNTHPTTPGKGSCFFIHVWRKPEIPTAGCTAMSQSNIKNIITWLNQTNNPILVQLPKTIYNKIRYKWKLPKLNQKQQ